MTSRSLANATTSSMNCRSTHAVVGLWGNERTITRGLGHEYSHPSLSIPMKSPSRVNGISRTSAPANSGE